MRKLLLVIPLLWLSGCATVHETHGPDGGKAYALNCSGTARGWDKCEQAAGDICKDKGYVIVSRSEEPLGITTIGAGGNRARWAAAGTGTRTSERTMLVECKP